MNYRKKILKVAYKLYQDKGPNISQLVEKFKCFEPKDKNFIVALNQLEKEKLLLHGFRIIEHNNNELIPDFKDWIAINPIRVSDIEKIIRPWYKDWKFWIMVVLTILGLIMGVLTLLKEKISFNSGR